MAQRLGTAVTSGLAGLIAALAVSEAHGQCEYEVTIIPPPPCPAILVSSAAAIGPNEAGEAAVGVTICATSAWSYFWSPDGGLQALPFPQSVASNGPSDLTDSGLIVGQMNLPEDGFSELAYLHDGQQVINLGTLPGGTYSRARAVNEQGWVVGVWGNTQSGDPTAQEAFIWKDGVMTGLGGDLGTSASWANDINDAGQVTGWMGESGSMNEAQAFIWQDGVVTLLPMVPHGFRMQGYGINNYGDVTGVARLTSPETDEVETFGFAWIDDQMTVIPPLSGFDFARGQDLNDLGQVVGMSWTLGSSRGFIWQNGVQTELNELIPEEAGVTFKGPSGKPINNAGQIAGAALSEKYSDPDTGIGSVAVLLTPVEGPPGDLDRDCRVGITDFLGLLASWGPCPAEGDCPADLTSDELVNELDFMILLDNWS